MILDGIVQYERLIIENPYNGTDYITVKCCGAKFLRDFGPFKVGEKVYNLVFDPMQSRLIAYDHFGDDVGFCDVALTTR